MYTVIHFNVIEISGCNLSCKGGFTHSTYLPYILIFFLRNILNLDSLVNKKAVSHNNKEGSRGHTIIAHEYIDPLITKPLLF